MKMSSFEKQFVNSPGHSQQVSQHAEKLLQWVDLAAGQKYLDVGCGNGAAPIHLAQKFGLDVTGVDVDPDQIRLAEAYSQHLPNVHFLTVDGTQLPFEASEFDIVATNKVMHHIPHWPEAVAEMLRVLKPGGYFIYSDLVFPAWIAAIGKTIAKNAGGYPTKVALDTVLEPYHLIQLYRSTSLMNYETVLRKN